MTKHPKDDFMDSYLLGTMSAEARAELEDHLCGCPDCFEKMAARDEIIHALKDEAAFPGLEEYMVNTGRRITLLRRIAEFFRGLFGRGSR
jgi:anti-sigma factor RsiW